MMMIYVDDDFLLDDLLKFKNDNKNCFLIIKIRKSRRKFFSEFFHSLFHHPINTHVNPIAMCLIISLHTVLIYFF